MNTDIRFGTGGWRAVIGEDFTRDNVRRVAAGIARLIHKQKKTDAPVMIGYDRRFLSSNAANWVAEVLTAYDINVMLMQRSAPTPLVMHTVKDQNLHYGIEITASHNPSKYNGIKLIIDEGRDADVNTTEMLESLIPQYDDFKYIELSDAIKQGKVEYPKNPFNAYIDDIIEQLDVESLRNRGLRVLFDTMHGSGTYPLLTIFYTTRCTIDTLNMNKDAYFGGQMPAPTESTLKKLKNEVVKGKYDLGIALDGDGDRLGIIDNNGRYITANEILCMLYYYLVKYQGWKGPVVRNLATTHMLDRIAESFGEKCYEVPIGFKHISAKIDEVDAVLGGESSGGLTVRGHIHGKDSVYAAALFAEMISVINKTPSEIMDELEQQFGKFVMVEDNLQFAPERKSEITQTLMVDKKLPDFNEKVVRVNYEDGCKVYFENGDFVICRFSGTEPLLRIFAESNCKETAKKYIKQFKNFLKM
ncbi:MAG: phosphoglucomutase/phosphomannomutase family protein [Bacteroidaceae bacterium]|nr:phosphoglucomutase/phosphomannomutase family protein [Bacteroidaceae bacterium]